MPRFTADKGLFAAALAALLVVAGCSQGAEDGASGPQPEPAMAENRMR